MKESQLPTLQGGKESQRKADVNIDTVRHLFPQLLANGFVPIPNRDKHCYLPGWPSILVDERQCRLWARQQRWPAIGLRVEVPLIVFDFDVALAVLAQRVLSAAGAACATVLSGLERQGSPPKTAFFLRLKAGEEPFHEANTRRFLVAPGVKEAYRVQVFAGGGGAKQFGCFGPHSHDERGNVLKTYTWVNGRSPANVPLAALPEVTRAEAFAVLDAADAALAAWPGLHVDTFASRGEHAQAQVYDLDESTVFTDVEGVEYSLDELEAEARARKELGQPQIRITGSFTGDASSSGSPRAKVAIGRHGLSIVDFKTGRTHRPLTLRDPIAGGDLNRLLTNVFPRGLGP
jgi:hypothetical protein